MMVLTSTIFMMTVYASNSFFAVQLDRQKDEALTVLVRHQQSIVTWGARCRLSLRRMTPLPSECNDAPLIGSSPFWTPIDWSVVTVIDNRNLRSRGITGLSDNWVSIWYPGVGLNKNGEGFYFHPKDGIEFSKLSISQLNEDTATSMMHGIVELQAGRFVLNSSQPAYNILTGSALSIDLPLDLPSSLLKEGKFVSIAVIPSL